jgi:hypothetical protein
MDESVEVARLSNDPQNHNYCTHSPDSVELGGILNASSGLKPGVTKYAQNRSCLVFVYVLDDDPVFPIRPANSILQAWYSRQFIPEPTKLTNGNDRGCPPVLVREACATMRDRKVPDSVREIGLQHAQPIAGSLDTSLQCSLLTTFGIDVLGYGL